MVVATPVSSPVMSPSTSTQTSANLSADTPRKTKLRKKLKALRRRKLFKVQSQKVKPKLQEFYSLCDKYLSEPLASLVKAQAILKNKKPVARRYSPDYKQFALTLYFLGPRAYAFLGKILCLPSKRSLQMMTQQLVCKPGLENIGIFKALEIKIKTMLDQDKHCTLCIDEMAIKSNLFYHTGRDEIVGLVDTGNETKEFCIAQNVLVIMARGLYSNWKQPIAYFFISTQFQANKLRIVLEQCILKLSDLGLHIEAIVSDMGSNFIELANCFGIDPNSSEFMVGDKKVIYLFDTCHLIKATRNNLLNNVFCFNGKQTSWTYIESFYNQDKQKFYRCAPKLTNAHIYPSNFDKMKVRLAVQVLSNTVASAMHTYMSLGALPLEAIGTIEVLEKFNKLFDLVNSSYIRNENKFKKVYEGADYQVSYLNEMETFLENLKIFNKKGDDVSSRSRTKRCWRITIKGIKQLWQNLALADFKYLQTRRVNSDCLENFFGSIRQQGGNSINPTPIQFERAYRKLFCQNYLHSNQMNCKDDLDELLINVNRTFVGTKVETIVKEHKAITVQDYVYRNEHITTQNAFNYVCGYLIQKALDIHTCDVCSKFSKDCNELNINLLYTYFKAYDTEKGIYGSLKVPSENFVKYIYNLEKKFTSVFEIACKSKGISFALFNHLKSIEFTHPCSNFPKLHVLKLFIRLKIFYCMKYTNRDIVCNKKSKNRKLTILSHL